MRNIAKRLAFLVVLRPLKDCFLPIKSLCQEFYFTDTCFLAVLVVDHLRRIRANETGRSLVELTGDGGIFRHLHRYFVFLLKAGGLRITECVLESPPRVIQSCRIV